MDNTESQKLSQTPVSQVVEKISTATDARDLFLPVLAVVVVIVGLGTGFVFSGAFGKGGMSLNQGIKAAPGAKIENKVIGLEDERTFRDRAEGVLTIGGIEEEGTHHLVRDGGPSQNVYLTSSVIDLDSFVGKKVEVWGETNKGQKAGWLMDVGKVRIAE